MLEHNVLSKSFLYLYICNPTPISHSEAFALFHSRQRYMLADEFQLCRNSKVKNLSIRVNIPMTTYHDGEKCSAECIEHKDLLS